MNRLAGEVGRALKAKGWRMVTAESCTGGLIAATITDVPGSSQWFEAGYVTYSNEAKHRMLGVPEELIEQQGAVSERVVSAMAEGALARSRADVSVAVSGVAGPDGGTQAKPVGTVWLAWALTGQPTITCLSYFSGDRQQVREQTLQQALEGIVAYLPDE